jgi:hypothetical protein
MANAKDDPALSLVQTILGEAGDVIPAVAAVIVERLASGRIQLTGAFGGIRTNREILRQLSAQLRELADRADREGHRMELRELRAQRAELARKRAPIPGDPPGGDRARPDEPGGTPATPPLHSLEARRALYTARHLLLERSDEENEDNHD